MNAIRILSATAALAVSSSAFAAISVDRPAALQAPVPVSIVHPTELSSAYKNYTTRVSLTIDAQGRAHDVQPVGDMPKDLQNRLLPAVSRWTFKPATDAKGNPVSRQAILPITLTEG